HLDVSGKEIRTALIYMALRHWIRYDYVGPDRNIARVQRVESKENVETILRRLDELAPFIIKELSRRAAEADTGDDKSSPVLFSVLELKEALAHSGDMVLQNCTVDDIEATLLYLTKIRAIDIDGGFLVVYKGMRIERKETNNAIQYKEEDYKKLKQFYDLKVQQIHIVGEYAQRMIRDYTDALQFVQDYFSINYSAFLRKYFPGSRMEEIKRTITPAKFRQLFGE